MEFIEQQGWQKIDMARESFGMSGAGKKPSSTRKYTCPVCGQSIRATKEVNVICGDCMVKMVTDGEEGGEDVEAA